MNKKYNVYIWYNTVYNMLYHFDCFSSKCVFRFHMLPHFVLLLLCFRAATDACVWCNYLRVDAPVSSPSPARERNIFALLSGLTAQISRLCKHAVFSPRAADVCHACLRHTQGTVYTCHSHASDGMRQFRYVSVIRWVGKSGAENEIKSACDILNP